MSKQRDNKESIKKAKKKILDQNKERASEPNLLDKTSDWTYGNSNPLKKD